MRKFIARLLAQRIHVGKCVQNPYGKQGSPLLVRATTTRVRGIDRDGKIMVTITLDTRADIEEFKRGLR